MAHVARRMARQRCTYVRTCISYMRILWPIAHALLTFKPVGERACACACPVFFPKEMATRYVPGASSIEIPLRDTDEVLGNVDRVM